MPSPLSGDGTLDKTVDYCQSKYLHTMNSGEFPQCKPSYKDKVVVEGRFVFQAHPHSTGCDVRCWVISNDDAYEIINTTYWYSSSYTFNKSKWESGAWDNELDKAIAELELMVESNKEAVLQRKELSQAEQDSKKSERKSKFEALFK